MADYVSDPGGTIKRKFSVSTAGSGGGDTTAPPIPPISTADLQQQPVPQTGPSPEQIASFYQPLIDQIQNEAQPLSRPVPAQIAPLGTFLGLLAGNLASTFSQNPAFAQQAQNYLAEQNQRRQTIEEQNYADSLARSVEKRNKLTAIRGQILEKQLDEAIKSGDMARADVASKNLYAFQQGIQRENQRQEAEQRRALIQVQGAEDRKTNAAKAQLTAEEELNKAKNGLKPMTTKEYLQGINDINKNKELKGPGFMEGLQRSPIGGLIPGGPSATGHEEALEQFHASAILNGEPTVKKAAQKNLKRVILTRLGLIGKEPDAAAKELVKREVEKYGLTLEDLQ